MKAQSGDAPLLFECKFAQLWTDLYKKFYGSDDGWIAGFVLLAFNVQLGAGRNSVVLTLLNFNVTASWNARRGKVVEMPNRGPQVKVNCFCGKLATAVLPVCEDCAARLINATRL